MLIVCKKISRRICQLVTVSCRTAATSQIRELESLCVRQRAIMNWPSGNRSFALTAPTSTPRGFSRSAQFISHPTALSGPFIYTILEYAKYNLNPMITDHFHVSVIQGLLTSSSLSLCRPRRFVLKIQNLC